MGHSRKRIDSKGRLRWVACYDDARGRRRSAGTFERRKEADHAWQEAEALQRTGRPGDPRAGRISFADYVVKQWLPHHVMEPTTREGYEYYIHRHLIPWFGRMRMSDILPTHVREWVSDMSTAGMTPATIRHLKIILSAIFTTALNDYVVVIHAGRGVKSPTVPIKEYRIVTPEEYSQLYRALPGDTARLFVETDIGSGLRWGELAELRPPDVKATSGILTVSRTVVELNPKFHPEGGRFHVKNYPKSKRPRRFALEPELVAALLEHISAHALGADDLLFPFAMFDAETRTRTALIDVTDLGLTEPNAAGRQYRHGTTSAYTAGKCRCTHCRATFARYRAERRAEGLDSPRNVRRRDTDLEGHLSRDWFRNHIWYPSCDAAGLSDPRPRLHDLRHSHASWLLAGGADLQVVKERMGHGSIVTTEKYLHTLPTADATALAALRRIKRPS